MYALRLAWPSRDSAKKNPFSKKRERRNCQGKQSDTVKMSDCARLIAEIDMHGGVCRDIGEGERIIAVFV